MAAVPGVKRKPLCIMGVKRNSVALCLSMVGRVIVMRAIEMTVWRWY